MQAMRYPAKPHTIPTALPHLTPLPPMCLGKSFSASIFDKEYAICLSVCLSLSSQMLISITLFILHLQSPERKVPPTKH